MNAPRVGVFGGTFDPIHVGHLHLADAVAERHDLREVLFIPMAVPAHRASHASASDRAAMVELAIGGNPRFALDRTGLDQPSPGYTIDTLALLRRQRPVDEFFFIAGIDALTRSRWRRLDEVADALAAFLIAARVGVADDELANLIADLSPELRARFVRVDVPLVDLSSTQIRELVAAHRSIRYLVPESVREYIESHALYRPHAVRGWKA